jgi:hypothetical protein
MVRLLSLIGVAAMLLAAPAKAQQPADPRLATATRAFEALPEAERKAIQADLIWTGHLNSAATGSFGPLTFRAVNGFKAGRGEPNGQLTTPERQELARLARTAREAAGFTVITDERTGVRIGIPQKLLPKREATASGGSRWQSTDGKVTLDVSAAPAGEPLPALFERATAANPNIQRRITYKLLQPGFFVVAGETPGGRFFRRQALGPAGLRGFSIGYDKALGASLDKVVTAIADSFEPFPVAAVPAQPPASPATPAPAVKERYGAGLVVGKELVLTAQAAVAGCKAVRVAARAARLRASDEANRLALLEVPGLGAAPIGGLRSEPAGSGEAVLLIGFGAGGGRPALALPGEIAGEAVSAPLQPGGAGSPVLDRRGRLAGLVTGEAPEQALIAGVAPLRSHRMASAAALKAMLDKADVRLAAREAGADLSTGAIVAEAGEAVVPLSCAL